MEAIHPPNEPVENASDGTRTAYAALLGTGRFRERPGQRALIEAIATTLSDPDRDVRRVCAEAPTGVGKTMAYLIGAYPAVKAADLKLVISSATIALQNQILNYDIPAFAAATGYNVTAVVGKGRGRYICDAAIATATGVDPSQTQLGFDGPDAHGVGPAVWDAPPTADQREQLAALQKARESGWNGDLDSPPRPIDPIVTRHVTMPRHGCAGQACAFFHPCAYRQARLALGAADIIVVNHDLLVSDLRMGGGVVLPPPDRAIVVIDEAHDLPETATEQFAAKVPVTQASRALQRLPDIVNKTAGLLTKINAVRCRLSATAQSTTLIRDHLTAITDALAQIAPDRQGMIGSPPRKDDSMYAGSNPVRWDPNQSPHIVRLVESLASIAGPLLNTLRQFKEELKKAPADCGVPARVAADAVAQLGPSLDLLERILAWTKWTLLATEADDRSPPPATWVETQVRGTHAEVVLAATTSNPAGLLKSTLLDRAYGVVLTSATLRAMGRFGPFAHSCGMSQHDGTVYLTVPSPFDLAAQSEIVVPASACDPKDIPRHTRVVTQLVERYADPKVGTLVLFTSKAQMHAVYDKLPVDIQARVLRQTDGPRNDILRRHAEAVAAGRASILMGLDSYSEGIDLARDLCRVLIIARLPFRTPNSPVEETRAKWLEERGRSYFAEETVPETHRRLVQRLGRLIRTEDDSGVIYVADRRLVSTTYGRRMWETLPPFAKRVEAAAASGAR